jgi:membrane protein YqaA with SNARE-associated domain
VEKETDEKGEWVKITLRGKWCVFVVCLALRMCQLTWIAGFPSLASRVSVTRVYIGKYESVAEPHPPASVDHKSKSEVRYGE